MRIAVLNGPNLNLLGTREPALYGTATLDDILRGLEATARELGVDLVSFQSNDEGALIDRVQGWRSDVSGALVNAGAYSHSSLALRDALTGVSMPFVEVHLTNIYAREPERRHSMLSSAAIAVVCGLGAYGYEVGLRGLVAHLRARG